MWKVDGVVAPGFGKPRGGMELQERRCEVNGKKKASSSVSLVKYFEL
jgi:hypothetical protein